MSTIHNLTPPAAPLSFEERGWGRGYFIGAL